MIKAIIFDFDGVLVESANIKTEAFREIFSKWPDKMGDSVEYHLKNMGISRYVKFRYFYENILGEPYSEKIGQELGRQFSVIVLDKIKKAPLVNGTIDFLKKWHNEYQLFIASGTPQDELQDIVSNKGIERFFCSIYGTPATKFEIVKGVLETYSLSKDQVAFVGDAESDKKAAVDSGIHFILRMTAENRNLTGSKFNIADLTQLEDKIAVINKCRMIT